MAREIVPEHGCDCAGANADVYARVRDVTRIESVRASCRLIVRASVISESWQSIGALESGSGSAGGHGCGCGRGSWQMLAEHRMKPFQAQIRVRSSLEDRARPSLPRMCVVRPVYS